MEGVRVRHRDHGTGAPATPVARLTRPQSAGMGAQLSSLGGAAALPPTSQRRSPTRPFPRIGPQPQNRNIGKAKDKKCIAEMRTMVSHFRNVTQR